MTGYADAGSEPGAPERGDVFSHLSVMRNMQESVKKSILGLMCVFGIKGIALLDLPAGFLPEYDISLSDDLASCVKCNILA